MKGLQRAFTVEGLNLERFIRAAGEKGVTVNCLRRIGRRKVQAVADEAAFRALEELAETGGWRLTAGERAGAGKGIDAARKRIALTGALIFAVVAIWAATRVMWQVEVVGAGSYDADVRLALESMGVSAPMLRSRVDPAEIRDALEWRYPRIAWFECGWRGMTLVVRAVEGILPHVDANPKGACDVVAARDGIVQRLVTRAGTPAVKAGELVQEGQVLIRGEERTSGGEVRPVAARGSVYARVWESAAVRMPLWETETIYTGREQTVQTVTCPWFHLWRVPETDYAQQDVSIREVPLGGFFIPLVLRLETRYEAECQRVQRDMELLKADGARAALQKLHEKCGGRDSLVDNWVNWSIIEDEILLSVATGEMLVDIAQQERSSDMAASD